MKHQTEPNRNHPEPPGLNPIISTSEPELGIRLAPEWVSGRQVAQ